MAVGQKDLYSSNTIGEAILEILWVKTYIAHLLRKFPEMLNSSCNSEASTNADTYATVKAYINDPPQVLLADGGA